MSSSIVGKYRDEHSDYIMIPRVTSVIPAITACGVHVRLNVKLARSKQIVSVITIFFA